MSRTLNRFPKNDIMSLTSGAPRYDLAESIGPDLRLRALLDGGDAVPAPESLGESLGDLALAYGTAAGDPALRRAIAAAHGAEADDVVVTVGGMHALFLLAFILCRPGDEAVTTSPLFPNAMNALTAVGADVKTLPVTFEDRYRVDPDALHALLTPRTRLVCLATPQNPSGVAIPPGTIQRILTMMAECAPDAYLLADETYRQAVYGDERAAPSMLSLSRKVVSCASLSKCHGAPGLRLGWAITRDAALREQLILGKFNTVIACSRADEALALRVFQREAEIVGERRRRLSEGLARTAEWVQANGDLLDWVCPDAGALCCLRLKPTAFDDAAVARFYDAMARHDVRVASGAWFGDEARVFRLGFGLLEMDDLDSGLQALSACLALAQKKAA
ncbi:pyridoxal phosphate-dependent aminotransferase [Pelagibius sp.]|uniref:pyridoxal phosphate-dependent aminotransferase n=1 Tax=Pelagibius sp. TaxID=1931238 RepID=UPI0026066C7B|nr:pyridoxal phosphate-dependent aminotransferase [Pelagibius sp.]